MRSINPVYFIILVENLENILNFMFDYVHTF